MNKVEQLLKERIELQEQLKNLKEKEESIKQRLYQVDVEIDSSLAKQ